MGRSARYLIDLDCGLVEVLAAFVSLHPPEAAIAPPYQMQVFTPGSG
jgi:hypothetical protein